RIAVRQVDAADDDPADLGLEITAVGVVGIARQTAPPFDGHFATGEDGDAVVALLPVPDAAVARSFDGGRRKPVIGGLDLLQAGDVGRGLLEPAQQNRQPAVHAVDVVRRNPKALFAQALVSTI